MLKGLIPANLSLSFFAVFGNSSFTYPCFYSGWSYGVSIGLGKVKAISGFGETSTSVGLGYQIKSDWSLDFGYSYYLYSTKYKCNHQDKVSSYYPIKNQLIRFGVV